MVSMATSTLVVLATLTSSNTEVSLLNMSLPVSSLGLFASFGWITSGSVNLRQTTPITKCHLNFEFPMIS